VKLATPNEFCIDDPQWGPIPFNPKNFCWLFNPDLGFSSRSSFELASPDAPDLSTEDFLTMRHLNRKFLSQFLIDYYKSKTMDLASEHKSEVSCEG
jgi:hypothetical protein